MKTMCCGTDAVPAASHDDTVGPVLIVACPDEDASLTRKALLDIKVENPIVILPSAEDLLRNLKPDGGWIRDAGHPAPALILLDLSNRHDSSFALLRRLHCRPGILQTPIAVLAARESLDQMRRAYQLGVTTFLRKPLNPGEFKAMTGALEIPVSYSSKTESKLFETPQ